MTAGLEKFATLPDVPCLSCGAVVPRTSKRGRPRVYCATCLANGNAKKLKTKRQTEWSKKSRTRTPEAYAKYREYQKLWQRKRYAMKKQQAEEMRAAPNR